MTIISVIIPVFNGEKTIRETLQSVLNQTFTDFEVIVIDDGSNDSTLEVVSSIKDSKLKVFSYSNAGQAESRNRGIAKAVGEYITFIDADDLWTPDKLEAQLKALHDHPRAAVAYSWTDYIDESGKFLGSGQHLTVNGDAYAQLLVKCFLENGSNPLIRSQALTAVGVFDKAMTPSEDWDLYLRLASRYQFVCVSAPQILYRISATSESSNTRRMASAGLRVIEQAFAQAPQSLQHLKKQSFAEFYNYLFFRSLKGTPERQKSLLLAQFFWKSFKYDRSLSKRLGKRMMLITFLKITTGLLLRPQQAQAFLQAINLNY